ncbi:MAG: hypothetical protein J6K63_00405 [Clostridia bacterium]|nr:hypothetical protein [Clostridia bacterium]
MIKSWLNHVINFLVGTMLHVVLYGLFGFVWNIVMGFMSTGNILWLYRIIIFFVYFCILNWWIYGTSKKQRKYLDTLPRDHKVTLKEDYLAFLKHDGLPIIVYYTICMSLQIFVFRFTKGYFQAFFALLAPIGIELNPYANWGLSFVVFVIGYQAIAVIFRKHIRKNGYDFLFEEKAV